MVNYNSDRMTLIRSARTVKDINVQVDVIAKSVRSLSQLNTPVASNSIRVSISAPIGKVKGLDSMLPTTKVSKPLDGAVDLNFDTQHLRNRAKAAGNQATLQQCFQELAVAYQVLRSKALGGTSEATRKTAATAIQELMKEITSHMSSYRKQAAVPLKEIPAEVVTISKQLANSVRKVIDGSTVSNKPMPEYYVAKHEMMQGDRGLVDTIVYQTFIRLDNFTNDEDVVYKDYSVVLTTQVETETGRTKYFLTTLTNAMTPGSFPYGKQVDSKGGLVSRLNELLAIDGADRFTARRVPMKVSTQALKTLTNFGIAEYKVNGRNTTLIDDIRVQNNKLYVRLTEGLTAKLKEAAVQESILIFSSAFRGTVGRLKKNDIVYKFVRSKAPRDANREFIVLSLVESAGANRGLKMNQAITQIAQALELSREDTRRLSQAIK